LKILVTGASGFVGGKVAARLRQAGHQVLGVGRRRLADPGYCSFDLAEPWEFDFEPDAVLHAAARASPWGSRSQFERDNVVATENAVEFCRRTAEKLGKLPRLVYVSSSSVFYQPGDQLGLTEESPIGPSFANDYAATKAEGEKRVAAYEGSWAIARPRAVFGPGDTVLFPRILAAARKAKLPILERKGPPAIGDLIYIDNLSDYLRQLVERPELRGAYNLTNGQPIAIQSFLLGILARLGLPAPKKKVPLKVAFVAAAVSEAVYKVLRLKGEPPITRFGVGVFAWSKTFDVTKTLRDLGPPKVSLEEGVEAFVAWQREQLE
jgi:nucleoside-diphosphate-sugar epimerase